MGAENWREPVISLARLLYPEPRLPKADKVGYILARAASAIFWEAFRLKSFTRCCGRFTNANAITASG